MITKFPNTISSEEFFLRYFFFSITSCTIMNVTIIHIYVFPRCVYVCVCVCVCVCIIQSFKLSLSSGFVLPSLTPQLSVRSVTMTKYCSYNHE